MGYFIFFILNFILAYFIYDESSYVKPLEHSILLLIVVVIMDLITKNKKKRKN
ncbi:hypothetical protein HMPREF0083_00751 [Aneurinibacillus aneurinilyticus ATCC 12856]|uniref:Uncharacterized protein n=1 Tax=Aneurinibacillus aneurinilyticus ATCC 12856 TaxID=649747 RepID=U1X9H8_ANEAE|nr:hypothetical protein HMPREF0083_00751 [Aneurinibacillus aneurinilyticus ATCC 12856]